MAKMNMVQAINLALRQEMEKDARVVVLGEDVGVDGGVFRVTDGLIQKFGEGRVIDTPLAESAILGTAIGMALGGLRPVAEMQFCGFSYAMFHQLEAEASRFRSRSQGAWSAPLVVRMPAGGGVRALEHHSESPEAFYAHVAGVKVVIPSGPRNARALLVSAIRDPDPVVFLEPKRSYRAFKEEVPEEEEALPLGKAAVIREGTDLTLVSWGAMTHISQAAVEKARQELGVSIEHVDLLTVSPMDAETIAASVRKTGRCVVVQEARRKVSVASDVVAEVHDRAFSYLKSPVLRVAGYDVVTPYFGREGHYIPDERRIIEGIKATTEY